MKTLLKGIQVVYPGTRWNGERLDLFVEDGTLIAMGEEAGRDREANVIEAREMLCFPALVDAQCTVGEPGYEYKEDFRSLSAAARAGGFSDVCVLPTTNPPIDSRGQVRYVRERTGDRQTDIHVYGTLTKAAEGKELSEMFDMHRAGAIAFSDGKRPVTDVNMMKRALEYVRSFEGLVCSFPLDERLNPGGYANEGKAAMRLGIKSMPPLAEELMLNRDLYLLDYTRSHLHVSTVSTAASLELVERAKDRGLDVTCAVALPNLLFSDDRLEGFDAVYKTNPPLRNEAHRQALLQALKDGVIDMICTDHSPENIENKAVEMDHAAFGMTMLETALSLAQEALVPTTGWDRLVERMALNPRKRFQLPLPELEAGKPFTFTVFDPGAEWTYDGTTCRSKSHNSPVFGQTLKGRVLLL